MKLRTWISTCSSAICTSTADNSSIPLTEKRTPTKLLASDTSSCSDTTVSATSSSSSSSSSNSTLQSNLSLQTLPSVPSLQKLLPTETLILSDSHHLPLTSLTPKPSLQISGLAVHDNLIYAASSHEINVYDRSTFTHLDSFNDHDSSSGSVKSITFCEGKIFTAHQDDKIRVWKIITETKWRHKLVTTLPTVNDRLFRIIFPKNYVNVRRHKRRLWIEHADAVTGLAVNKGLIYSVSWDKTLKIWRASDLRCIESVIAHEDAVNAVVVSGDGTVYTGSADKRIRVWAKPFDEKRHVLIATLEKHKSAVNALALNNDGSVLFSGACDRSILVWEREDSANHMGVAGALRGHGKAILCLINVNDMLFSGSADRTVRIWQRGHDGRYCSLSVLEGHRRAVKSLSVVTDHSKPDSVLSVFGGSLDGEIKVWQVPCSNLNVPLSSELLNWNL